MTQEETELNNRGSQVSKVQNVPKTAISGHDKTTFSNNLNSRLLYYGFFSIISIQI